MPELPDITIYVEALQARIKGAQLDRAIVFSPFALRSVDPPLAACFGRSVVEVSRLGKRIVMSLDDDLHIVLNLMIAGRLLWSDEPTDKRFSGKLGLATFRFSTGSLGLVEAGTKRRASITVVRGEDALRAQNPGGIEPLNMTLEEFKQNLNLENRTLKRALTNPHWFSGIGNAYSDEILHAARLSPVRLSRTLNDDEVARLYEATRESLTHWTDVLRWQFGVGFPKLGEITAFRKDFAVHGKFGQPCPDCGKPVQRIRYESNETNYCAACQNEGRLLADRALSRLLKADWPKTLEEMEGG